MAKAPIKPVLDPVYRQKVLRLLNERHGSSLRDERFELDARREGEEAVVRLVLRSNDNTNVYTMEAAIESSKYPALTEAQAVDITLDFLDWYVGEYFREERDALLPLDWKSMRFGDLDVMARGDVRNEFLDDAADAWLRGEHEDVQKKLAALKRH
ncbi:MAG: hypothetical protein JNJ59_04300 [Deltaproteobacteria bacterium]|jgi:hypothetical protein|nr:hypothetical protein [Deltaproteobacteria bacterium]